ncbi:MAG: ATP-binding protein [Bacteroides sp.]|nr:ATP-binding protein [Bacteroides sp.]
MFRKWGSYYPVRLLATTLCGIAVGVTGIMLWQEGQLHGTFSEKRLVLFGISLLLLVVAAWWQYALYRSNARKVLFMLDAIENNDSSIHFGEETTNRDEQLVNKALNRMMQILCHVKSETVQQEKYYEIILDCISTGVLVINEEGAVYQKNNELLRLLGMEIFTHVRQLARVDNELMEAVMHCRPGNKLQTTFSNERGTVSLAIRVSGITVKQESLRILAVSDINNELNEKEIESWIRLTRVLTHEIMNAVTPITSLSDTLLGLMPYPVETSRDETAEELRNGLQTISSTGKGLLTFVESYRKFTRIPTPEPSLFYVREFMERMAKLARHNHPDVRLQIDLTIEPDDLILHADENLIAQVVINLLKNAIQAIASSGMPEGEGRIGIHARCDESEAVLIEISNNGPAIPPEVADHIFIPFFSTKEGGSGIGLSISRQIMRLSGGSLSLLPGPRTTFVLKFN